MLATRVDILAGAIQLMAGSKDRTIEAEQWWSQAVAAAGPHGRSAHGPKSRKESCPVPISVRIGFNATSRHETVQRRKFLIYSFLVRNIAKNAFC